jgi:hypothetical protein
MPTAYKNSDAGLLIWEGIEHYPACSGQLTASSDNKRSEVRRQTTQDRGQRTEDRGQRTVWLSVIGYLLLGRFVPVSRELSAELTIFTISTVSTISTI